MKKLILIEPAGIVKYRMRGFHYFEDIANRDYFRKISLALGVLAGLTPPDWEIEILQEPADRINFDARVDLVGMLLLRYGQHLDCRRCNREGVQKAGCQSYYGRNTSHRIVQRSPGALRFSLHW